MEKTMNGSFLRRIFSCERFSEDYGRFIRTFFLSLDEFKDLMMDDNRKKIKYLAEMINEALSEGNISKI